MLSAQFIAYGWLNFGKSGFVKGLERVPEDLSKMDLKGRIALVTGGNAGLGYHTCEMLARAGARVLMVVRNLEKGKEAAQKIGGDVDVMLCDVSLQGDVDKLISQVSALDVLVLNAGTLFPNERVEIEGVERTLGEMFIPCVGINSAFES
jgi:NAD(P)-dependent dehydrogenase (short-subunit alcohol dehydrogenase family)